MSKHTAKYIITDCGFDEYPGDGLRLIGTSNKIIPKEFMDDMGVQCQLGDEVEITVQIISRLSTKREPL